MHDSTPHHSDMKPAFIGLIVGAIALLVMVVSIVKITNGRYNAEHSAAETTR